MNSVRDYLHSDEELVLISNIGRVLDDLLESHPVDNDVNNLYKLLDIEQKGFVMGKDIYDFIAQLEDSQAEDVETIGQLLWKYTFYNLGSSRRSTRDWKKEKRRKSTTGACSRTKDASSSQA